MGYNADNNKDVTPKNVVAIVEKIAKNKKPNMPQIFVQLSPVLDLLHTLESGSKRIDIIIGQYADVLEDNKSSKETLHLFKKILDNEVLKQRIHSHPGDSMKKQKKPAKGQGVLDSLLQEFFKNKNPAELLSLMNGDLSALSNILGSTDLLGILKTVIDSFFSSSPYGPIIQQYAGKFLESEQGRELIEGAKEMMAGLAESTSILETELVEPVLKVWHVYTQAAELPKCAAKFLCEINSKERKSEAKKVGVVKAASYAASWTMSKASTEIYWKLYHAVNAGSAGADCDKSYPSTNCVLRERLIDHSEL